MNIWRYQYGHTFILHNELVANYKLICLNCVHLSDNKFVFSSIINIFWHKLLIFHKIVEQHWNSKRCKIKVKIHYERMMQRAKNSISKRQKKYYSRIKYLCKRSFILKRKQFPLKICYAVTIKKRVTSPEELKILIINNDKQEKWYTKNYSLQRGI